MEEGKEVAGAWLREHRLSGVLKVDQQYQKYLHRFMNRGMVSHGQGFPKQDARSPPQDMAVELWSCGLGCWAFRRFGCHISRDATEIR